MKRRARPLLVRASCLMLRMIWSESGMHSSKCCACGCAIRRRRGGGKNEVWSGQLTTYLHPVPVGGLAEEEGLEAVREALLEGVAQAGHVRELHRLPRHFGFLLVRQDFLCDILTKNIYIYIKKSLE
jgi:hypothetical protein